MANYLTITEAVAESHSFNNLLKEEFKKQLPKLNVETSIDVWHSQCQGQILCTVKIHIDADTKYWKFVNLFSPTERLLDANNIKIIKYESNWKFVETQTTTKRTIIFKDTMANFCKDVVDDIAIFLKDSLTKKLQKEIEEESKVKFETKRKKYAEEIFNEKKEYVLECFK